MAPRRHLLFLYICVDAFEFIKKAFHCTVFISCILSILQIFIEVNVILSYSFGILKTARFNLREAMWFSAVPTGVNLIMKTLDMFLVERTR